MHPLREPGPPAYRHTSYKHILGCTA